MKQKLPRLMLIFAGFLLLAACAAADAGDLQDWKMMPARISAAVGQSWARSPLGHMLAPTPAPTPEPTPDPTPEPTPEPTPVPTAAEQRLAAMTLQEKLWQLLIVHPTDLSEQSGTRAASDLPETLAGHPVGGIFFNSKNMTSKDQITALTAGFQSAAAEAGLPALFTVCDEEGGRVARLMRSVGTRRIGPMLDYEQEGGFTAFSNAETIAEDMASCGFNLDFAPVADVWSNPKNTVIGDRAYSTDFEQAAWLVKNAVQGFHYGGVACTLKHFPGHGDTPEDSHTGAAYVYKSLDELRGQEFLPFKAGIDAGADLVMVGHITVPSVGDKPALLSSELLGLLRKELDFSGVIITDALEMGAVGGYSGGELAVQAILAGVDMLLLPVNPAETAAALEAAVESGVLTEERIDESVLRILTLKEQRGLLK